MGTADAQYLNDLHDRELAPTEREIRAVQGCVDQILEDLEDIAEVHPCGSWAKGTMLRGRKEADIVAILSRAPDDRTLAEIEAVLAGIGGATVTQSHKAVQVSFGNGVHVDVLPVARGDRTPPGDNVPRKLRHALSGPQHVRWFKTVAKDKPLREVVRLAKRWRDARGVKLPSFAIEVIAANAKPERSRLDAWVMSVLGEIVAQLQDGPGHLDDPVVPGSNILLRYSAADADHTARVARAALKAAETGSWSQVITATTVAPPGANLGGRTLG